MAVLGVCAVGACTFPDIRYVTDQVVADGGDDATSSDAPVAADVAQGADAAHRDEGAPDPDSSYGDGVTIVPGDDGPPIVPDDAGSLDASPDSGICACEAGGMYPTKISCGGVIGLLCGQTQGFTGTPACGESGQYVQCSLNGLACSATYTTRQQRCR